MTQAKSWSVRMAFSLTSGDSIYLEACWLGPVSTPARGGQGSLSTGCWALILTVSAAGHSQEGTNTDALPAPTAGLILEYHGKEL